MLENKYILTYTKKFLYNTKPSGVASDTIEEHRNNVKKKVQKIQRQLNKFGRGNVKYYGKKPNSF